MGATRKISTIEEYVDQLKKGIGKVYVNEWGLCMCGPKWPKPVVAFNTEVRRDSIKHFVDAIGDLNPIFRDREYAKKTKYSCLIAPPTFLHSVAFGHYPDPPGFAPLLDFPTLYAGDEYEWFGPLCEGYEIDFKTTFPTDIELKQSKLMGTVAFMYGKHEFNRHRGGIPIATCNFWIVIFKRSEDPRATGKELPEKPVYTEEYIREVYAAQDREVVRGSEPRYWEDVEVGEELTPVVRGPHTLMDTIAWVVGGIGEYYFCSSRLGRFIHEHTGWGTYDPDLKIYHNFHESTFDVHGEAGGIGSQRTAWVAMVLTNWMGDDGFIWKLRTEHRGRGGYGSVYWCKAKVISKYCDKGRYCVDIDCWVENQIGSVLLKGNATVLLPSRNDLLSQIKC